MEGKAFIFILEVVSKVVKIQGVSKVSYESAHLVKTVYKTVPPMFFDRNSTTQLSRLFNEIYRINGNAHPGMYYRTFTAPELALFLFT